MSTTTALCPRCGIRRQTHTSRTPDRMCLDCRLVEPHWPNIPPPPSSYTPNADAIVAAIDGITRQVFKAVAGARLAAAEHRQQRTCCTRCGCLTHPDETCPGCRAKTPRKVA